MPAQEEQTDQTQQASVESMSEPAQPTIVRPKVSPAHERERQLRREIRKERYDEVIKLYEQGVSQIATAILLESQHFPSLHHGSSFPGNCQTQARKFT